MIDILTAITWSILCFINGLLWRPYLSKGLKQWSSKNTEPLSEAIIKINHSLVDIGHITDTYNRQAKGVKLKFVYVLQAIPMTDLIINDEVFHEYTIDKITNLN